MTPIIELVPDTVWHRVEAGRMLPLRMLVTMPEHASRAVIIPMSGLSTTEPGIEFNFDLWTQEIRLEPGDSVRLTVSLRFHRPGNYDLAKFFLQVNPDGTGNGELVSLPAMPVVVLPVSGLRLSCERICGYEDSTKLEIHAVNESIRELRNMQLFVGPAECLIAGPTRLRRAVMRPSEELKFELIARGDSVGFTMNADIDGIAIETTETLPVPLAGDERQTAKPFRFLEPRSFTNDTVILKNEDSSREVTRKAGVYHVHGGTTRYRLTIIASHTDTGSIRVYTSTGRIEVEPITSPPGEQQFILTVVENSLFTHLVRMDYDAQVGNQPLRGEIHFAIRPTWKKWLLVAATAGFALTAKGCAAFAPAVFRSDVSIESMTFNLVELVNQSPGELLQMLSIPVIYAVFMVGDLFWRIWNEA